MTFQPKSLAARFDVLIQRVGARPVSSCAA
jgi:hypothetical protein